MITKKNASLELEADFGPLYFSDLLRSHRLGEELTQVDLAKKLKVSKQKICDYENGRRLPSMETIVKWAKKLKEPHEIWVKAYLQQLVDDANLTLRVEIKSVS
jgi:DNA-binding XRE family transcriptional regulator